MNHNSERKSTLVTAWLITLFVLLTHISVAQVKGSKNDALPTVDIVSNVTNIYSGLVQYQPDADKPIYGVVNIGIKIAGKPPKNDLPLKLTIQSFNAAGALFLTESGTSNTISRSISKELFKADGSEKLISLAPVTLVFKALANGGDAYIGIQGKTNFFHHVIFDPLVKKADNPISEVQKPVVVKSGHVLSFDNVEVQKIQLDSFKKDGVNINKAMVKLFFKLDKAQAVDTNIKVTARLEFPYQTIKLSDNADQTETYTIPFEADNWSTKQETKVVKGINMTIQQTAEFTTEQNIIFQLKVNGVVSQQIVKILPFTPKTKPVPVSDLVKLGGAQILDPASASITHNYGASLNNISTIIIKVKLNGEYDEKRNKLDFVFLDTSYAKRFKILNTPLEIRKTDWKDGNTLDVPLEIKTLVNDTLAGGPDVKIILKGQQYVGSGTKNIKLAVRDLDFWAEVGANFDLLDNIKTNNFYAGIFVFNKDIARIATPNFWIFKRKGERKNNLSFVGGVYESQAVSTTTTSSGGVRYRTTDSIYRDTGIIKASTSVKSIGILFSPMLRLNSVKTEANGFHIYTSLYLELLWQTVRSDFDYKDAGRFGSAMPSTLDIERYPYREKAINYDFKSSYYGIGLPLLLKDNSFSLYINPVLGLTNQGYYIKRNYPNQTIDMADNYTRALTFENINGWNAFLLFQYRLNAVAYGLTFSGEIRGLLNDNSKPVATLAISKKFNIDKLFKDVFDPVR